MQKHILITGLAGNGKSTLAMSLSTHLGYKVVNTDVYRYGPGWTKLPFDEYFRTVMAAINSDDTPKIIEGTCHDAHDPEDARKILFYKLLDYAKYVLVIKELTKEQTAASLIDRCINRAFGGEPGVPAETSIGRAKLLIKSIECYNENVAHLHELIEYMKMHNISYLYDDRNILKTFAV